MTDANPEATRTTGASGLRELVQALYRELHTWRAVATACNGDTLTHGPGYYHQIATGRIGTPSEEVRAGIELAPVWLERLLTRDVSKAPRRNVSFSSQLWDDMQAMRRDLGESWEEFGLASLGARKREPGRDV